MIKETCTSVAFPGELPSEDMSQVMAFFVLLLAIPSDIPNLREEGRCKLFYLI
jgi:hypothetical protein